MTHRAGLALLPPEQREVLLLVCLDWFDGPFSYALAGELGHDAMRALARAVYGQLVL